MKAPTPRQLEVLRYIEAFHARHQRPPTITDLATFLKINRHAARNHLRALAAKRLVTREAGKHAAIAVTKCCHS